MENKVIYNLDKIVSVRIYPKKVNGFYADYQEQGWRWWRLFGKIPLFKYYVDKPRYKCIMNWVNEDEISSVEKNCYSENGVVYYKPHISINFVGEEYPFKKYFETEKELEDYWFDLDMLCTDKCFLENISKYKKINDEIYGK